MISLMRDLEVTRFTETHSRMVVTRDLGRGE